MKFLETRILVPAVGKTKTKPSNHCRKAGGVLSSLSGGAEGAVSKLKRMPKLQKEETSVSNFEDTSLQLILVTIFHALQ